VLLAMAAGVWATGGFHEDGWADTCDGLGGAVSREKALIIMKDSRIGSYGALGLILMLGLKAACLVAAVGESLALGMAALLLVQCGSRAAPLWLLWRLPYAGDVEHAKAKPLATQAGAVDVAIALGWALLPMALVWLWQPALALRLAALLLAVAAATLWMQRWLRRRLGGYTGDNLGATQQVVEAAMLLAWCAHV
jgi:adenosylcobinamide-GDP ribazoletransferase